MVIDTPESLKARLEAARRQEAAVRRDCLVLVHAVAAAALRDLRSGHTTNLEGVVAVLAEALGDDD
jgi:hypothetical protein